MCTRNVIFLDKDGAKAFCRGKEVPTKSGWCSRGYVAVSFNGIVLGCAFFDGEKALNMVPQHKRIAGGNEHL
jgi:NOL1/NOP2/fmu family ribosome biogenesis protein